MTWLYREALTRYKGGKKFKDLLMRVNEPSGALEPYKLLMIFKDVEQKVHMNAVSVARRGKSCKLEYLRRPLSDRHDYDRLFQGKSSDC
jgi:hypothetical protein